jgi:integrase/recombinase XerD
MAMPYSVESRRQRRMNAGDIEPLVAAFVDHLSALGYASLTVICYEASARHFAHWLTRSRIDVADVDDDIIRRFARHQCRCPGIRRQDRLSAKYVKRTRRFVEFLSERGIVQRKATSIKTAMDRRVLEFQEWLRRHRGICEATIDRHGHMVMRLLPALGSRSRSWNAQRVREAILAETKHTSIAHVKTMATALRGYLRFLSARGLCRPGLDHAAPTVPQWRLSASDHMSQSTARRPKCRAARPNSSSMPGPRP